MLNNRRSGQLPFLGLSAQQRLRGAGEGGVVRQNHFSGNGFQVIAEATLGLETFAKRRAVEKISESRHDAAADIHAATRAKADGKVSRCGSQHAAEGVHHVDAQIIVAA